MEILLAVAAAGFIAIGLVVSHWISTHGFWPLVWRWLSGHALDGEHRTNATWLHPATKVLHRSGRAVRWHHMPRLHRAGVRTGVTGGLLLTAWGLITDWRATIATAGAVAACVLGWTGWLAHRALRTYRHHRMWVAPVHRALGPVVALPPGERPSDWIQVERDRSAATITLPSHFTGHQRAKDAIESTVTAKLALEAPRAEWSTAGPRPVVRFRADPAPPRSVVLGDLQDAIETARDTELVLGMGRGRKPVLVSLDEDSPHIALSQGSGSGKSTTGRLIGAQALSRGAVLMVWDYKRISQAWARGLPNVCYCRTVEEIHAGALWLLAEIERRNQVADAGADIEGVVHADVGPRIIVLAEELNATMNRLRAYWRQVRQSGDPDRSPAVEAIEDALFMGRQVRVNIVAVGQKMSVRASASGEARENMGIRILGRYTSSAWKMLVDLPFVPSDSHPGRVQVVTGNVARETQVGRLTGFQARQLAMSGTVSPWPSPIPGMPHLTRVVVPGIENPGPDQGVVTVTAIPQLPAPDGIRLSDAVDLGVVRCSLGALRRASHRDPAFPHPVGWEGLARLYDPEQLHDWEASRAGRRTG